MDDTSSENRTISAPESDVGTNRAKELKDNAEICRSRQDTSLMLGDLLADKNPDLAKNRKKSYTITDTINMMNL